MEGAQRIPPAVALSLLALGPPRPLPAASSQGLSSSTPRSMGPYTMLETRPLAGISKEGDASAPSVLEAASASQTDTGFALMSRAHQVLLDFQATAAGTRAFSSTSVVDSAAASGVEEGKVLQGRMIDIRDSILANEGALVHRCVEARRLVEAHRTALRLQEELRAQSLLSSPSPASPSQSREVERGLFSPSMASTKQQQQQYTSPLQSLLLDGNATF